MHEEIQSDFDWKKYYVSLKLFQWRQGFKSLIIKSKS